MTIQKMNNNDIYVGCDFLNRTKEVFSFFTTRNGGYSEGNYYSMNCTHYCGDNIQNVLLNRKKLLDTIPYKVDNLIIPRQVHQDKILVVDNTFLALSEEERENALYGIDALVTSLPNTCICISTADCVPITIITKEKVIAMVHAGWRGTVMKIASKVVSLLADMGCDVSKAMAYIGPSISMHAFEVGDEVYDAFSDYGFDMGHISERHPLTNKWHINLWAANKDLLQSSGLQEDNICVSGICNWSNYDMLFSARRLGINSGRILSGVMLI